MFDKQSNTPENDPLKGKFDGLDQALRASAELKKAAKTGIPLYRSKRESTAVHLRRFAKATVAYAAGVLLFLGAVMMLPKLWESDPVNSPGMNVTTAAEATTEVETTTEAAPATTTEPTFLAVPADGTPFEELSEEFKAELLEKTSNLLGYALLGWGNDGSGSLFYYYGIYDGCVVCFTYSAMINAEETKIIGNELFYYPHWFNLMVFRSNEDTSLEIAYENGWISDDSLALISEQHKQMLEERFGKN